MSFITNPPTLGKKKKTIKVSISIRCGVNPEGRKGWYDIKQIIQNKKWIKCVGKINYCQ